MRKKEIDDLRGLAMLAMMIIHSAAYFLNNQLIYRIWDFLQWAVPIFIFCSFYLTFSLKKNFFIIQRLKRLYLPYFYFLISYFFLLYFFDKNKFNLSYFLENIFLTGGIEFNWLVLLFIYLTILTRVFFWLEKRTVFFYGVFILSLISSIFFIFFQPVNFRIIMWLPWLTLVYFSYFLVKNDNDKFLFFSGLISLLVFIASYFLEMKIGHRLSQFANKYPPTIFHLSYGSFSIVWLYFLAKKRVFGFIKFDRLLNFLSFNSYSLYFIHALIIHFLLWNQLVGKLSVIGFFLIIFFGSILIQFGINKMKIKFIKN